MSESTHEVTSLPQSTKYQRAAPTLESFQQSAGSARYMSVRKIGSVDDHDTHRCQPIRDSPVRHCEQDEEDCQIVAYES